jgi:hypothetical protein
VKQCKKCKEFKNLEDFYKKKTGARGVSSLCNKCDREYHREYYKLRQLRYKENLIVEQKDYIPPRKDERAQWSKEDRIKNPSKYRNQLYKTQYGITLEQYNILLKSQDYKCANNGCTITHSEQMKLCVDHCHTTKEVRGLLCRGCNTALGQLKENTERICGLMEYKNKFLKI